MSLRRGCVGPRGVGERRLIHNDRGVGGIVVVLGARAEVRRERIAVDPDLLVALTVPGGQWVVDSQRVAHEDASPLNSQEIPVDRVCGGDLALLPPCGVEIHRAIVPSPVAYTDRQRCVDVLLAQVQELQPGRFLVRHDPSAKDCAVGIDLPIPACKRPAAHAAAGEIA